MYVNNLIWENKFPYVRKYTIIISIRLDYMYN